MTLTETDRLIRRLRETLKAPDDSAAVGAAGMAQTYADECNAVSRRLEQCAAMLDAGDEQQALQLAESVPSVLDLLTLLAFAESRDWRAFCTARGLPSPSEFEPRLVSRLNALYAKGITTQHPLYRDYRTQVMKNQTDAAAATLRAIVRLNPSDSNARQELARLEENRLASALERLSVALKTEPRTAIGLVDDIEDQARAAGLSPTGPAWIAGLELRQAEARRAALAESRAMLPQLESLRAAGKWQAASPMLAHLKSLQAEHAFTLDGEEARQLADFQAWVVRGQRELTQQQDFQRAFDAVDLTLEQGEQRHSAGDVSALPALRGDLARLVAEWRAVESFERPIPEGLEPRYRKRVGLARAEIDRLQKLRTTVWMACSAAAVLICAAGIYFVLQHRQGDELAAQLHRLVDTRQVGATEKLLADARANNGKLLEQPDAKSASAVAAAYIQSAHEREREIASTVTTLTALSVEQPHPFSSQPLETIQALLDDAEKRRAALAPEQQAAVDAPLAAIRNRWDGFLTRESDARNAQTAVDLDGLEKTIREELSYRRPPEKLKQTLAGLKATLQPVTARVRQPPIAALKTRDDLGLRLSAVETTTGSFTEELAKFDAALLAMRNASALDPYLDAVRAGQNSELRDSPELAPAKRLLSLQPTADSLLSATLMPNDPDGWEYAKANPNAGFVPTSTVLEPERRIYDQLLVDSNIRNVYFYQFRSALNKVGVLFSRGVLEGGTINGEKFNPKGSFYRPGEFPTVLNFEDSSLEGRASSERLAPDSQAFLDLKFRDLIDTAADRYSIGQGAPLHEFLDRLTRSSKATPLFKAFVFARIYQMMQVGRRSGFFGVCYTPALSSFGNQITKIVPPSSGYWMVPDEVSRKKMEFEQLFASASKVSFAQQGRVMQSAIRASIAAGVAFHGFADASGAPELFGHEAEGGLPPPDLWGWGVHDAAPARLFSWSAADKHYKQVAEPVPLSPLLAAEQNPVEILRAVCKRLSLTDDEVKNSVTPFLPPWFKP